MTVGVVFVTHATRLDNEAGLASGHFAAPWRWRPGWTYEYRRSTDA